MRDGSTCDDPDTEFLWISSLHRYGTCFEFRMHRVDGDTSWWSIWFRVASATRGRAYGEQRPNLPERRPNNQLASGTSTDASECYLLRASVFTTAIEAGQSKRREARQAVSIAVTERPEAKTLNSTTAVLAHVANSERNQFVVSMPFQDIFI